MQPWQGLCPWPGWWEPPRLARDHTGRSAEVQRSFPDFASLKTEHLNVFFPPPRPLQGSLQLSRSLQMPCEAGKREVPAPGSAPALSLCDVLNRLFACKKSHLLPPSSLTGSGNQLVFVKGEWCKRRALSGGGEPRDREQRGQGLWAALAPGAAQSPRAGLELRGQCLPGARARLARRGVSFILCCRF